MFTLRMVANVQDNALEQQVAIKALHQELGQMRLLVFRILGTMNPDEMDAAREKYEQIMRQVVLQTSMIGIDIPLMEESRATYEEIIALHYDFSIKTAWSIFTDLSEKQYEAIDQFLKNEFEQVAATANSQILRVRRWSLLANLLLCLGAVSAATAWALVLKNTLTDRRISERRIAEAQALLDAAIQQSPAGIIIVDAPDNRVRLANAAALAIRAKDELHLSQITSEDHPRCWGFHHPETRQPYPYDKLPLYLAITQGVVSRNVEMIVRRDSGEERWVSVNASPVRGENGAVIAAIALLTDITDRKAAEEERRKLETQVQHAQKLESLGVLAGGIAHDFNNILVAILGNADLALQDLSPVAAARGSVEEIERAARRAADLCRQMLAYSGKGRFEVRRVNLSEMVEEMAHMLEVSISKKAVLRYKFADALPAIEADATQMRQVIMNLIINASEAIGARSGVISVATGIMPCDREYLRSTYLADELPTGDYVYIEVADTGCGMDKDTLSRIFDPFFTTKFTGRGLGLAAVMGIVRGHKGMLKVYSEPNRGTTFKALFPAVDAPADPIMHEGAAVNTWQGQGNVLLVDDEESIRTVARRMLEKIGFTVVTASDGRDALRQFQAHNRNFDCVLLDLTMPHMDGEECFRELRRLKSTVRVVMSSGYNEQEVSQRFSGKGLAGFIQKPYRIAQLKTIMQQVMAGNP